MGRTKGSKNKPKDSVVELAEQRCHISEPSFKLTKKEKEDIDKEIKESRKIKKENKSIELPHSESVEEVKTPFIVPPTPGIEPQKNPKHYVMMVDLGEMHRWMNALIALKDNERKISPDAKQIMKEIKTYIEKHMDND